MTMPPDGDEDGALPANLRFLKTLVTVLTAVMILGVITIVVLLVIRLNAAPAQVRIGLPDTVRLPEGAEARAITAGDGWYAVVTADDEILVFDAGSGVLRQRIEILPVE